MRELPRWAQPPRRGLLADGRPALVRLLGGGGRLPSSTYVAGGPGAALAEPGFPAGFLLIFLYWQIAPMVTASIGASLDLRKLLVYPIPRGKLFRWRCCCASPRAARCCWCWRAALRGLVANPALGGWRAAAARAGGGAAVRGLQPAAGGGPAQPDRAPAVAQARARGLGAGAGRWLSRCRAC